MYTLSARASIVGSAGRKSTRRGMVTKGPEVPVTADPNPETRLGVAVWVGGYRRLFSMLAVTHAHTHTHTRARARTHRYGQGIP